MIAAALSPLGKRLGLIGAIAVALVVVFGSPAEAQVPTPAAVVVDGSGTVVAEAGSRSEAPAAFEEAFMSTLGGQLRLEYIYRAHGSVSDPPNDPYFGQQWNLARIGVSTTWAQADGSGVVVAVLDSAVNLGGLDGICAQVVWPYDAIDDVEGVAPLDTTSEFGHGTHVAGTIAQCTNNGTGVAGIAPGVTLMPVRVLAGDGTGTSSEVARGIDWAVDHGADIINMSLGSDCESTWPTCDDTTVSAAIERARAAGVLLVASSGNSALPYVSYPATHPDVVAVGAVDSVDSVWVEGPDVGSNQGTALDLVAPGTGIIQETTKFGAYGYFVGTGTSMAAPHVSAAAALVLSVDSSLTADAIVAILKDTAVDVGSPGFDTATGWGRIAVDAAVLAALPPQDPCGLGPCDSVVWVDVGEQWGLWDALTDAPSVSSFYFGDPGDVPFMGDWDGDGVATPGLYRQSDGFVYLNSSNTQGNADLEFAFGNPGDVPLAGDFDGDGRDSVSIWRPSEARVFVINELGQDGRGLGEADFDFYFGNPGDTPFVGDFDGDGIDTVGLYRQATGFVYFRNSNSTGVAHLSFFYGDAGDQILAGDWDGDGDDAVAVYRPSTGRLYINLENEQGVADWDGYVGLYPYVLTAGNR